MTSSSANNNANATHVLNNADESKSKYVIRLRISQQLLDELDDAATLNLQNEKESVSLQKNGKGGNKRATGWEDAGAKKKKN